MCPNAEDSAILPVSEGLAALCGFVHMHLLACMRKEAEQNLLQHAILYRAESNEFCP